jgi:uncharacterized protein (TIGR03086 family)
MIDLSSQTAQVTAVVRGISADQLDDPTPCEEMTVRILVAHLHGLSIAFRDAAKKIEGPTTSTPPDAGEPILPEAWREETPIRLAELAEAWRAEEAWQGTTRAGGVTMPADEAGLVALDELVLHGWDLAVATGQPYRVESAVLAAVEEFVGAVPDAPEARAGLFGPPIPIDPSAPRFDRVLGQAGRDPAWAPGNGENS